MLDNGSPLGSSLFFSPSAQATALVVVPQNMDKVGGLPLYYKVNQIYSWQPSPPHAWHLKFRMELGPSLMYPVFPKHNPLAFWPFMFQNPIQSHFQTNKSFRWHVSLLVQGIHYREIKDIHVSTNFDETRPPISHLYMSNSQAPTTKGC
jgi:hypothetical protein